MPTPAQTDPTAVTGRRVLAAIIDWLIIAVPTFLLLTASFEYVENPPSGFCDRFMDAGNGACVQFGDRAYFTRDVSPTVYLLGFGLNLGILVILQGLTGMTPGKLVAGIRNVREDGRAPGILKAFVRWLLWIVDAFPYALPLVGFITAVSTPGHRRVGDMAAKTFVVRASAAGSPVHVPGLTAPAPSAYAGAGGDWAPGSPPGHTPWGPPTAPPSGPPPTPPATSTDPTAVGWGGPVPSPGEPPSAPAWPTPGAETAPGAPSQPAPDTTWAAPEAPSQPAPDTTWAAPGPAPEATPSPEPTPEPAPEPPAEPEPAPEPPAEPEPRSDLAAGAEPDPGPQGEAAQPVADAAPAAPPPQWDDARGTYIQWDPAQGRWLQWDEPAQSWTVIPGQ